MSTIYGQTIPADIFKYRSVDTDDQKRWLAEIVSESRLFFSTPDQFNDPFDCAPVFQTLRGRDLKRNVRPLVSRLFGEMSRNERRQKVRELLRTPPEAYEERLEEVRSTMRETGIYSLSADPANLLLWSHYTSSHRGVCLHFDMRALHEYFTPSEGPLGLPVVYSDDRPVITVGTNSDPLHLMQQVYLVKARAWAYEQEWRFLHYRSGTGALSFPSEALRSIILGASISQENETFVRSLAKRRPVPIPVRRAVLHEAAYAVRILD